MKALTISQPFASLIASGEKWIENRTWKTNYRGPIAIHAGKGTQYCTKGELENEGYPTGCIVAVAQLVACVLIDEICDKSHWKAMIPGTSIQWRDAASHEHAGGPFCWILDDVKAIESPIVIAGQRGLWDFDEGLIR